MPALVPPARIPTPGAPSIRPKELSMLDILFFGGGLALFCLFIAYERICHRI
jgi:hypothetical protein